MFKCVGALYIFLWLLVSFSVYQRFTGVSLMETI